jgi:hypothetical protein
MIYKDVEIVGVAGVVTLDMLATTALTISFKKT